MRHSLLTLLVGGLVLVADTGSFAETPANRTTVAVIDSSSPSTDSLENRRLAAERCLEVQPMQEMLDGMTDQMTKMMPAEQQAGFKEMMKNAIDIKVLEQAAIDSMAKNFTLKEIEAMTNFYASPEGKSVMKKMPDYMRDVMPVIQQEIRKSMAVRTATTPPTAAPAKP